jgi:inosine/xanthosine triphosphatase
MKKIIVGTKNRAKLSACKIVFDEAYGQDKYILEGIEVDTGVSAMPMTNQESYLGAHNRLIAAKDAEPNGDIYVGLEGGVEEGPGNGLYLLGWAVVMAANSGKVGVGHSGGVRLPNNIAKELKKGKELGPLVQEITGDVNNEIRHSLGTNGLLTNGLYPRNREFEDALRNAVGMLLSKYYE